jgi:hypothetical protein
MGKFSKASRRERLVTGQHLDKAKHENAWNRYCGLRDQLIEFSRQCETRAAGSTPKPVKFFLTDKREKFFAIGMPPTFYLPKNQLLWLKRACSRCRRLLQKIKPNSV